MAKTRDSKQRLRERAEEKRSSLRDRELLGYLPSIDEKSLVQELQVHQIELEMQNEELREIQAELEDSRKRYMDLYDFAPVGYLTLDTYGMIFEANLTVAAQLNVLRGSLVGRHLQAFMDRESADAFHLLLKKTLQPGEKATLECRLLPEKGAPVEFTLTATGEFSHTGRLVRYRVILSDVSRIKQMERQALETGERLRSLTQELNLAEELTRRAIAQTLHDSISQTLAMARMKLSSVLNFPGVTPTKENIDEILDLLAAVLKESRELMTEVSPPVLHELGLAAGVDWIAEKMSSMHGIAIKTEKEGNFTGLAQNEKIMLYQMVRELLNNVARHSGARNVELTLKLLNQTVNLTVWDDGRGFDARKTGTAAGTGFGLFNIRERLKAFKGTLKIDSTPGQGTTVMIHLPITEKSGAKSRRV